ncbi:dipeptide/oligopeptide/nickel ABC transporter permease/ATP-binding protein [Candidatus Poriferisodalis sp.]|uniref:dipeptide/oligopeptide/nickel ABC transporter permease/ATP-binding protein n=1 Tax=Candidatus Poriferisodalis sp. TaxID=3101277 RepID=UPI003B015840
MSDASTAMAASAPQSAQPARSRSQFWVRMFRNPLTVAASVWVTLLLLAWLWPGLLAPHDPYAGDVTLTRTFEGPSWDHWLGTDGQGRDFYSRVVHGARFAVNSIVIAMVVAVGLGVPVGLFSGWRGGRVDRIVMWINDVLFSLPIVLLAMAVIIILEPSLPSAMLGVGIAMATRFARLTRAVTLAEKEELYVDAARITGLSPATILRRYIAPNLLPSLIVQVAIISGAVILIGATLSFLGIGAKLDDPDWGVMLATARLDFRLEGIWQIVPAGGALVLTVLAFNLLGDGIRDSLGRDAANSALTVPRQVALPPVVQLHASGAVLSIRDLAVGFPAAGGTVHRVLSDVSLEVYPGETLGVVGESGSGKSMTMLAALGLTPPPGYLSQGSISFDGREVTFLPESEWREIRGRDIGVIFQEPVAALNPALKVGRQLMQSLLVHTDMTRPQARARAAELLAEVQVPDPERRLEQYPHEFSGGMAQRVGIAMALACEPKLLIADEPTTALDVTVQGQILDLMAEIQERHQMAVILITHDLGVIADAADRVLVMYAGQVVETATVSTLFSRPRHPYTQALLSTMPQSHRGHGDLPVIGGVVPSAAAWPDGCRFAPRCEFATDQCRTSVPLLEAVGADLVRCVRHAEFEFGPGAETSA